MPTLKIHEYLKLSIELKKLFFDTASKDHQAIALVVENMESLKKEIIDSTCEWKTYPIGKDFLIQDDHGNFFIFDSETEAIKKKDELNNYSFVARVNILKESLK